LRDPERWQEITIGGFGACMISGRPHDHGGFFQLACEEIAARSKGSVTSTLDSFGGFPAPRAAKYLQTRVLKSKPDFVIIQFGSTDAACPFRSGPLFRSAYKKKPKTEAKNGVQDAQSKPATTWSYVRWYLSAIIGFAFQVPPITPLPEYLAAIDDIIDQCLAAGTIPIVLTPFVYGSPYSTRSGVRYAKALRRLVARKTGAIFVDAMLPLLSKPRSEVLQNDGFHLSKIGHALVASAIAEAVCKNLQESGVVEANIK
jgi:lysophospholipase L1-like esterase